jgi:hypothetical protein
MTARRLVALLALLGACELVEEDDSQLPVSEYARENGETCRQHLDCAADYCGTTNVTGESRCYGPRRHGEACLSTFDCRVGICTGPGVCYDRNVAMPLATVAPAVSTATSATPAIKPPCVERGLHLDCDVLVEHLCSYYELYCDGHENDDYRACRAGLCDGLAADPSPDCTTPLRSLQSGSKVPACPP